jgi:hypothetical protein
MTIVPLGEVIPADAPIGDYEIIGYLTNIFQSAGPGGNQCQIVYEDSGTQTDALVGVAKNQIIGATNTITIHKGTDSDAVTVQSQESTPGFPADDAHCYLEILYRMV